MLPHILTITQATNNNSLHNAPLVVCTCQTSGKLQQSIPNCKGSQRQDSTVSIACVTANAHRPAALSPGPLGVAALPLAALPPRSNGSTGDASSPLEACWLPLHPPGGRCGPTSPFGSCSAGSPRAAVYQFCGPTNRLLLASGLLLAAMGSEAKADALGDAAASAVPRRLAVLAGGSCRTASGQTYRQDLQIHMKRLQGCSMLHPIHSIILLVLQHL